MAQLRLKEARVLLRRGNFDGAYYLSGYVIECALKVCIAKNTRKYDFPDRKMVNESYTHNLNGLVKIAGLGQQLDNESRKNPTFDINWGLVKDWTEESRYQRHSETKAKSMISAITSTNHGVLRWIRQHW